MAELFGEWQTEEFQLPRAVGGIVPRVSVILNSKKHYSLQMH